MTNIMMDALNGNWNRGFARGLVQALHMDVKVRYRSWRRHWMTLAELRQFSADQLAELGIDSADISRIAGDQGTSVSMPFETEGPTRHAVRSSMEYRREEEFRSALDSYLADYQKHRAVTTGNTGDGTRNAPSLRPRL